MVCDEKRNLFPTKVAFLMQNCLLGIAKTQRCIAKHDKKQENVAESNKNACLALWISEIILYLQCHPLIASVSLSVVSE